MKIKYFENVNTYDELKKAYRDLMKQFHPDLNKNKEIEFTEICKQINSEFEFLHDHLKNVRVNKDGKEYEAKKEFKTPKEFMDIINKLIVYPDIQIDIIGSWIWCSENTKPIKEILKDLHFTWHSVRKCWYLKFTNYKSTLCDLNFDELQEIYGGQRFNTTNETKQNLSLAVSY